MTKGRETEAAAHARLITLGGAMLVLLALAGTHGCARTHSVVVRDPDAPEPPELGAPVERGSDEVYVSEEPPAPRDDAPTERPSTTAVWVPGHWRWYGGRYQWEPGHWELNPRGREWAPGHWAKRPRGWVWVPGHWRR